jgi:alkaline phosphatase D
MQRRAFLGTSVLSVAGLEFGCNSHDGVRAEVLDAGSGPAEAYFPQSLASGDPRPTSVVLWTRVVDPDADEPLDVRLEMALDEEFRELLRVGPELVARPQHDFCVRVRVEGLDPGTTYYYRFSTVLGGKRRTSRTGRTRTAPAQGEDVSVRFAVMSCQDYSGRYYHALRRASELDLDFVVHLGDYVYETADDPSFQSEDEERRVVFDDVEGALHVEGSAALAPEDAGAPASRPILAARSLDNYRQLYRTYRSDPDLQRLHELFPIVCVWDDHEFTNDAHGATGTYTDGRQNELDPERRANADQAWTEYMPIDFPAGPDFEFDREAPFPDNLRIYRSFEFGKHLHLVMTDLRRYRSDHVIAEDAFPGAVALDQARLVALLGEVPARATPYIDVDDTAHRAVRAELRAAVEAGIVDGTRDRIAGNLDVAFINDTLGALGSEIAAIDPTDASLERGIPYSALGKTDAYSSFGARYFVDYEVFNWIARARYEDTDGASEDLLGMEQEAWFVDTLQRSEHTWKVWGNEFALLERRGDLRGFPVPEDLARELLISADDWDGAPNRRRALLERLQAVDNLVVVTGDLHSFFAGTTGTPFGDRVIEFMCGAVSSSTYRAILEGSGLSIPGIDIGIAAGLLLEAGNPHLAYQELISNGFGVVEASGETLAVTFHQIPFDKLPEPHLEGELSEHFHSERFRVAAGSARIERQVDGEWRSWDATNGRWT